jgi:hypothetical protein
MAYIADGHIAGARAGGSVAAPLIAAQGASGSSYIPGGTVKAGALVSEAHAPFTGPVTIQVVQAPTLLTGQRWPR